MCNCYTKSNRFISYDRYKVSELKLRNDLWLLLNFFAYYFQVGDVEGTNPRVKGFHAAVSLDEVTIMQCGLVNGKFYCAREIEWIEK